MPTVIDHSETLPVLNIQALDLTVVEKDAGTPAGQNVVVHAGTVNVAALATLAIQNATVDAGGINLAAGSTVDVGTGGHFNLGGLAQVDALSNINIGTGGTVWLGSGLGVNLLSSINFMGPGGTLALSPSAQGPLLTPGASGEITNFGAGDKIDFRQLAGNLHAQWTQNLVQALLGQGTVQMLNAQNQVVGSVVLHGSYSTSEFKVVHDGHGGNNLTFV